MVDGVTRQSISHGRWGHKKEFINHKFTRGENKAESERNRNWARLLPGRYIFLSLGQKEQRHWT